MHKRKWTLIILWLILGLVGQARSEAQNVLSRADDPTLAKQVTIATRPITLHDLLAAWKKQTQVAVGIDEQDAASSIEVAVYLHNSPLDEAMDALRSLLSYRQAEWEWKRVGGEGAYRYQLIRTPAAEKLAGELKREIQTAYERDDAEALTFINLPPEQRKARAAQDARVKRQLGDERTIAWLRMFDQTNTPEMKQRILKGQATHRVNFSELPPEAKALIKKLRRQSCHEASGYNSWKRFASPFRRISEWQEPAPSLLPTWIVTWNLPHPIARSVVGACRLPIIISAAF